MKSKVETITPKKALKFLEAKAPNRQVRDRWVKRLAGAITSGHWVCNGEAIKFNDAGQMIDGQHRCLAIVLADIAVPCLVVRGLPNEPEVFDSLDGGNTRTISDVLSQRQESNYAQLACAVAWLWRYNHNLAVKSDYTPRNDEAILTLKENPEIRDSCKAVHGLRSIMSTGMAACLHLLFSQAASAELATQFFSLLARGENLSSKKVETSGIYKLREYFLAQHVSKYQQRRHKYSFLLVVKAWNATVRGNIVRTLKFTSDEDCPEITSCIGTQLSSLEQRLCVIQNGEVPVTVYPKKRAS